MLKNLRKNIIQNLWESYCLCSPDIQHIKLALSQKGITELTLDHFAIIDLPGPQSGIPHLREIFSQLGYSEQGKDYLADKQNDFLWMAEAACMNKPAIQALPQVVLADFRFDEMPKEIRNIIYHYSSQTQPSPLAEIQSLLKKILAGDEQALKLCAKKILAYFAGRDWSSPTIKEFYKVREFNELLAWVLVFGRRPNHFTLSVHLLEHFDSLSAFHQFIENETQLFLNQEGGIIKGNEKTGIAQASTAGILQTISLCDGDIQIPTGFVEFIWRFPKNPACLQPQLWDDYFTGFIAKHADNVIESLYSN